MPRIEHVKKAQQRYDTRPVLNDDGTPKIVPVLAKDGTPKTTKAGKVITMRVTENDLSRPKPLYRCDSCGLDIAVGTPYMWVDLKQQYGSRRLTRHASCPTWKQSELTSSKMAGVYAAQEACDEQVGSCESVDDLTALANDLAEMIREVANEYEESADNMEEGFGHATSMSDDLREKADSLNAWADDIESTDFDEYEGDDDDEADDEDDTFDEDEDNAARDTWLDEQRDRLTDALSECPI